MIKLIKNIGNIDLGDILFYFTSSEIQKTLLPVKIVFLLISAVLLGIIIFTISRTHYFQWLLYQDWSHFVSKGSAGTKKITKQWNRILRRLESASESEYKLAVIEADDILDSSLEKMGCLGETLEEKLSKLTLDPMPDTQRLYEIHRLRDNIVHNPDYRLTQNEARRALEVCGKAFVDLQILSD